MMLWRSRKTLSDNTLTATTLLHSHTAHTNPSNEEWLSAVTRRKSEKNLTDSLCWPARPVVKTNGMMPETVVLATVSAVDYIHWSAPWYRLIPAGPFVSSSSRQIIHCQCRFTNVLAWGFTLCLIFDGRLPNPILYHRSTYALRLASGNSDSCTRVMSFQSASAYPTDAQTY